MGVNRRRIKGGGIENKKGRKKGNVVSYCEKFG